MITKPELIKKIKGYFDLNIYETKVWLALLSKGIASAGEIAEISNVPRSRTYDVLENLEKKGFAIEKIGKPIRYVAVDPSSVIERLKRDIVEKAKEKSEILSSLKESEEYKEIEKIYSSKITPIKRKEIISTIKGSRALNEALLESLKEAKRSFLFVGSSSDLKNKEFIEFLLKNQKNLDIRIGLTDTSIRESLKGLKLKQLNLPSKFCIIDGSKAFISLSDTVDGSKDFWIQINAGLFASALHSLFDSAWNKV